MVNIPAFIKIDLLDQADILEKEDGGTGYFFELDGVALLITDPCVLPVQAGLAKLL